jgi:pimeloyl-ACP methyl ester carboxylesterase
VKTGLKKLTSALRIWVAAFALWVPVMATGETAEWEGKRSDFHGFALYDFSVDGIPCKVAVPATPAPGMPWVWRARFWGHKPNVDVALLKQGFHIAYADVSNLFGAPKAVARWDKLYDHLVTTQGFHPKPALEGMSRGGLIIYNWAARNPDKVSCIYGDAPVCDIKSWPGAKGKGKLGPWDRCMEAYGFTEEEAMAFRGNPIDNLGPLAQAGIPLLHVVGDSDEVVPVEENTAIVEKRYRDLGGKIQVIHKPGVKHVHGLDDPTPIVDFINNHTEL